MLLEFCVIGYLSVETNMELKVLCRKILKIIVKVSSTCAKYAHVGQEIRIFRISSLTSALGCGGRE